MTRPRPGRRAGTAVLVLSALALLGLLLEAGSLPHRHGASASPCLYNQEHDISALAVPAGGLAPEPVALALALPTVARLAEPWLAVAIPATPLGQGAPRAPPLD